VSVLNLYFQSKILRKSGSPYLFGSSLPSGRLTVHKRKTKCREQKPVVRQFPQNDINTEVSIRCMASALEEVDSILEMHCHSDVFMDYLGSCVQPEKLFLNKEQGGVLMPAKKKQATKPATKKAPAKTNPVPVVQNETLMSPEPSITAMSKDLDARITRVDALIEAAEAGKLTGRVPEIRNAHSCQWGKLIEEDIALRRQILTLKQKENMLLGLIRDRVAENVIETADEATQQGVLKQPEA
jgi:hypothetical protein